MCEEGLTCTYFDTNNDNIKLEFDLYHVLSFRKL